MELAIELNGTVVLHNGLLGGGVLQQVRQLRQLVGADDCLHLFRKFIGKFSSDPSFQLLSDSLKAGSYEEAFRAAHTLKGVSQNLSFTKLYQSSHEITEALRTANYDLAVQLLPHVETDYALTPLKQALLTQKSENGRHLVDRPPREVFPIPCAPRLRRHFLVDIW